MISCRVILSAVAVSATTGTSGNCWRSIFNCVYSGRKSCPHCEIQCASSMANNEMRISFSRKLTSPMSLSGEIYSSLTLPCRHSKRILASVVSSFVLFRARAMMPFACKLSTWSFISDIRGETTMAVPSMSRAGSW